MCDIHIWSMSPLRIFPAIGGCYAECAVVRPSAICLHLHLSLSLSSIDDGAGPVAALSEKSGPSHRRRSLPPGRSVPVSYTHLRAHETPEHLVCRLLLEK